MEMISDCIQCKWQVSPMFSTKLFRNDSWFLPLQCGGRLLGKPACLALPQCSRPALQKGPGLPMVVSLVPFQYPSIQEKNAKKIPNKWYIHGHLHWVSQTKRMCKMCCAHVFSYIISVQSSEHWTAMWHASKGTSSPSSVVFPQQRLKALINIDTNHTADGLSTTIHSEFSGRRDPSDDISSGPGGRADGFALGEILGLRWASQILPNWMEHLSQELISSTNN